MNVQKLISILTGIIVLFVGSAGFVLSFDNLRTLALSNGITPSLVWLWPCLLDSFVVACSLTVLRGSLSNERTILGWTLLFVFTVASVTFNVIRFDNLLTGAIHGLPALVNFLSIELLTGQVKSSLKRTLTVSNVRTEPATAERKAPNGDKAETLNALLMYFAQNPNASLAEAGQVIGRSKSTVKLYADELMNAGQLRKNGDGWKVATN